MASHTRVTRCACIPGVRNGSAVVLVLDRCFVPSGMFFSFKADEPFTLLVAYVIYTFVLLSHKSGYLCWEETVNGLGDLRR